MAHIGVYAYSREALLWYAATYPCYNEQMESLEQLRFLDGGYPVQLVETNVRPSPIDSWADLEHVRQRLSN